MWKWLLKKLKFKRRRKKPFIPEKLPPKKEVTER